jgi:hypothetical protein
LSDARAASERWARSRSATRSGGPIAQLGQAGPARAAGTEVGAERDQLVGRRHAAGQAREVWSMLTEGPRGWVRLAGTLSRTPILSWVRVELRALGCGPGGRVFEALVAALEQWPESGVPDNPGASLMATAKHRAVDRPGRAESTSRRRGSWGARSRSGPDRRTRIEAEIDDPFDATRVRRFADSHTDSQLSGISSVGPARPSDPDRGHKPALFRRLERLLEGPPNRGGQVTAARVAFALVLGTGFPDGGLVLLAALAGKPARRRPLAGEPGERHRRLPRGATTITRQQVPPRSERTGTAGSSGLSSLLLRPAG